MSGLQEMHRSLDADNCETITLERLRYCLPKLGTKIYKNKKNGGGTFVLHRNILLTSLHAIFLYIEVHCLTGQRAYLNKSLKQYEKPY